MLTYSLGGAQRRRSTYFLLARYVSYRGLNIIYQAIDKLFLYAQPPQSNIDSQQSLLLSLLTVVSRKHSLL